MLKDEQKIISRSFSYLIVEVFYKNQAGQYPIAMPSFLGSDAPFRTPLFQSIHMACAPPIGRVGI